MAQISKESIFIYDGSITLQNEKYDSNSKKCRLRRFHNKKVLDQTKMHVDLSRVANTLVMKLHQVTSNMFVDSLSQ